jgi:hypothetical protein
VITYLFQGRLLIVNPYYGELPGEEVEPYGGRAQ